MPQYKLPRIKSCIEEKLSIWNSWPYTQTKKTSKTKRRNITVIDLSKTVSDNCIIKNTRQEGKTQNTVTLSGFLNLNNILNIYSSV